MGDAILLESYFQALDPAEAEAALERVVEERAGPLIHKIVRSKLAFRRDTTESDVEDVCSDAMVSLISSLAQLRDQDAAGPISDFDAFAAVIAYRACSDHVRRKYPEFHRLRNRLRYLLKSTPKFSLWQRHDGEWRCGLSRWNQDAGAALPDGLLLQGDPLQMLEALFERSGGPVAFDHAVRIIAQSLGVVDRIEHLEAAAVPLADPAPLPDDAPQRRQWLARLWSEIIDLPPKQRFALLLNLRDDSGACATTIFIASGVAGMAEIAAALGLTIEEFAEVWRGMPLEDLEIARRLGATRQQVINLRKCARERLSRRIFSKKNTPMVISRADPGQRGMKP